MIRPLHMKTALITGAAKRVGAVIAQQLHAQGFQVAIHYRSSKTPAQQLCDSLNQKRPHSAFAIQADLSETSKLPELVEEVLLTWDRLDLLVNNASSFYSTPISEATETQWEDLLSSNLKAPFFLSQAAAAYLKLCQGSIINIIDIHAYYPLKAHPIYSIAKAGLVMLTKTLAKELAPDIRVNGIAPGLVLWPEGDTNEDLQKQLIRKTLLKQSGTPEDIAAAAVYLSTQAPYMTGQVLCLDGGRTINL